MKVTNDHYKHTKTDAWQHDNERVVYITDDSGCTWEIRPDRSSGIAVRALGTGQGDDQVSVHARVGNEVVVRAGRPD